jgi:hypothetical protein
MTLRDAARTLREQVNGVQVAQVVGLIDGYKTPPYRIDGEGTGGKVGPRADPV